MAVKLAVVDIAWYSPIPAFRLIMAMGYMRSSVNVPMPKEYKYRWIIQVALKKSDGGRSAKDREEYDGYMKLDTPFSVVKKRHQHPPIPISLTQTQRGLSCPRPVSHRMLHST